MKKFVNRILPFLAVLALVSSCMSARKMTYLLDMDYEKLYPSLRAPEITIHAGDILGISVAAENSQLAAPFNYLSGASADAAGASAAARYPVDQTGNISFPQLGNIPVAGKTLREIRDDITHRISSQGYIREPLVQVTLTNFTVTVVGTAGNKVLDVTDPSINLLQVIARSNGTGPNTNIRDVMVVRTVDGDKKAYSVNLQKKDLFTSPVFFLQQNDVVYVKPQGASLSSEGQMVMTFVGSGLTLASIITNFLLWSRR